jgi:UDPglucose--hexose-1-phosphate uridylyltransferase
VHEVETTVNFCPGNRILTCLVGGLNYTPPEVSFPSIRASPGPADVSAAKRCERAVRAVEPPSICNRCSGVTELRRDPITGRLVAVAHERGLRPGAWRVVENEEADCPFCAGREERTPPETLRYGEPWRVRVVPNLYPALERQEVVIHCPEHHRSLAELDDGQLELVAAAWQERARAAREDRFAYVHALVNEGREAGSSLPHSHSQLVWLREPPPAVTSERGKLAWTAEQVVLEADRLVGFCPYGARMPYETCVAPAAPEGDAFESKLLAPALQLLAVLIRRLERVLGERPPLNVWLHDGDHWHLELLPRLTVLAGVELGAGIYVNAVPPEAAATDLRKA